MNKTLDPPVLEFQTKIINDFENTEFAGRESKLILDPEDFRFNINTEYFKDQLQRSGFHDYATQLFLRSLQKIAEKGHFVKKSGSDNQIIKSGVDGWKNFLGLKHSPYWCINERMHSDEYMECQILLRPKTRP